MKLKELIENLEKARSKAGDNAKVYISPYADCYKVPYAVSVGESSGNVFIEVM